MEKGERFLSTHKMWKKVNEKLYQDCKAFLIETLKARKDNEIDFNYFGEYMTSVTYDGGNNPEYDAYPYSSVIKVYLKGNDVYLSIEDDDEYSITRINADELCGVAISVYNVLNPQKDDEDEEL